MVTRIERLCAYDSQSERLCESGLFRSFVEDTQSIRLQSFPVGVDPKTEGGWLVPPRLSQGRNAYRVTAL